MPPAESVLLSGWPLREAVDGATAGVLREHPAYGRKETVLPSMENDDVFSGFVESGPAIHTLPFPPIGRVQKSDPEQVVTQRPGDLFCQRGITILWR